MEAPHRSQPTAGLLSGSSCILDSSVSPSLATPLSPQSIHRGPPPPAMRWHAAPLAGACMHWPNVHTLTHALSRPPPTMQAITFTCNVCEARQQKTFTKHSYEKGVVIISCDGCSTKHLIADNLGW